MTDRYKPPQPHEDPVELPELLPDDIDPCPYCGAQDWSIDICGDMSGDWFDPGVIVVVASAVCGGCTSRGPEIHDGRQHDKDTRADVYSRALAQVIIHTNCRVKL